MIPSFVFYETLQYGLLPKGIHKCSDEECEQRLVLDFPTSVSRGRVYAGFQSIRVWIAPLRLTGWHWLDGSFVTQKLDPEDLDVVTFLDAEELDELSADDQTTIMELIDGGTSTKPRFDCDTFLEPIRRPGDPSYNQYIENKSDWADFFGKTNKAKTGVDLPKGIVELSIMHDADFESNEVDGSFPASSSLVVNEETEVQRSAEDLEQRLASRARLRQRLETSGDQRFSTRLQVASLKKEEAWLQRQLTAAQAAESQTDRVVLPAAITTDFEAEALTERKDVGVAVLEVAV